MDDSYATNPMIRVDDLIKTYGKQKQVLAVNKVSFSVKQAELFGLIGPDGAGKTSIFRILSTLLLPDSGVAVVGGYDVYNDYEKIRAMVGYMPGRFSLYQDLSVEENLHFFATLFKTSIAENYAIIKDIYKQLEPFKSRRAGKLSGGMKQKLALCCALIHRPRILLLDEPTTGVDPVSRKDFWDILVGLKKQGITIVVSTPYMDEAALCDQIALIKSGRILSVGKPEALIQAYPDRLFQVPIAGKMYEALQKLSQIEQINNIYAFGSFVHLSLPMDGKSVEELAQKAGIDKEFSFKQISPLIEDCFIRMAGIDDSELMQKKN